MHLFTKVSTYTSGVKKVSLVQEKKKADEATTRTPYQTTQPTHNPLIHLVSSNYANSRAIRTQSDDEVYANIKRRCDRRLGKETNFQNKKEKRVFERAKDKTTSCAPYKRERIVLSTLVTFCPVNSDKTNFRKQTSVYLL